jgi:putative transposase
MDESRHGQQEVGKASRPHLEWYSRGYLPHADFPSLQFVTFRLADSVPKPLLSQWKEEHRHLLPHQQRINLWRRIEAYADAGAGACWLRRVDAAQCLISHLVGKHESELDLKAWVIMPNHVHMLVGIPDGCSLPILMKSIKGASARDINLLVGRRGRLWHREYFDRFIRDEQHYANTAAYIENNPVKARLAKAPEEWPFSSAYAGLR